jgi:nicotinamidase-related amidase
MPKLLDLNASEAAIVVIDLQQRLAAAMNEDDLRDGLRKVINVLECGRLLGIPTAVTEQYPKGLGPTLPMISEAVNRVSSDVSYVEKTSFSCMGVPEFRQWVRQSGRSQILLVGIETHVCVFQTARDLVAEGYVVHVPADTTLSRTPRNHQLGLELIGRAGGVVTSSETVIFDLLEKAEGEAFKTMSKMLK